MKCPNCGTENVNDAKFCQMCARALGPAYSVPYQTAPQQIPAQKKSGWSVLLIVGVVVIVIILIAFVVVVAVRLEVARNIRSGTLSVTVENDDWFSGADYDLYLDDVLKVSDRHIGALRSEVLTFTCTWYDSEFDAVEVSLHDSNGDWHYDYASVPADGIAYAHVTI